MDSAVLFSAISLLVGVLAALLIAKYYYRRTVDKALVPYVDFYSELFAGIAPKVRESLKITYQDIEVDNLLEVQFLIANTGEKPVRDLIKPLKLELPESVSIVDATLLHVHPKGREVSLEIDKDKKTTCFRFDLLNKNEFFVVKLLLNGKMDRKDLKFSITADDLPPTLQTQNLQYDMIEQENQEKKSRIEWDSLIGGALIIFLGISVFYLAYVSDISVPGLGEKSFILSLEEITLPLFAKLASFLVGFVATVIGIVLMFDSFSFINIFGPKKRFVLPEDITRSGALSPDVINYIDSAGRLD